MSLSDWLLFGAIAASIVGLAYGLESGSSFTWRRKPAPITPTPVPVEANPPHIHNPIPIGAQPLKSGSDLVQLQFACTVVLYRCECGIHNTIVFTGSWDIGDFLKTESGVSELERLAAK